ncbi:MAG: DegV family protein [Anaerolineaceae bacterium]|nr:DegV family protein [Anaerolineaceae bacterium]
MNHRVALITDSTSDIPAEWVEQYDITIVPLSIIFGSQVYLDGVDMAPVEFYERLLNDPQTIPTTSQPTPSAFLEAYQKAAAKGAEEILVITISGAMSGTIVSAQRAAEESPIPVHILDGKSNSMGIGWQVIAAARVREAGGSLEDMMAVAEKVRPNVAYYISLDTITYLSKGGRIGDALKLLNSVLKIKPLIYVNPNTGTVGASIPARSRASAIEGMYKEFFKHIRTDLPMHITVLHNNALEEAQALAARVREEFNPVEMFISIVSPTLGVHTGPRAIALCGYAEM